MRLTSIVALLLVSLSGCWDFPESLIYPGPDSAPPPMEAGLDITPPLPDMEPDQPQPPPDMTEDQPQPPPDMTEDQPQPPPDMELDQPSPPPDMAPDQPPTPDMAPDQAPPTPDMAPDQAPQTPDMLQPDSKPLLGLGVACTKATQCASGFCANKVCCNKACTQNCWFCGFAGKKGTCTKVPDGKDPANDCKPDTTNKCGQDGFCDGKGKCRFPAAGTFCGTKAKCSATVKTKIVLPFICTTAHTCVDLNQTAGEIDCGNYLCNTSSARCFAICSSSLLQCKSGTTCGAKKCGGAAAPLGATCTKNTQCATGKCIDGFCCDTDCKGKDDTCAQPGAWGRCISLKTGK